MHCCDRNFIYQLAIIELNCWDSPLQWTEIFEVDAGRKQRHIEIIKYSSNLPIALELTINIGLFIWMFTGPIASCFVAAG